MEGDRQIDQHTGAPVMVIHQPGTPNEADHVAEKTRHDLIDAFMVNARKRFRLSNDGGRLQRTRSYEEVEFDSGKHWDSQTRQDRDFYDRVTIEVNRTPQYLQQVANEQRMTRPQILIKPMGNTGDPETAQIKNGLIRSIEKRSDAETIRDDAFYNLLQKGWTYWRVNIQYESERSRRQVLRTGRIENDFAVYDDPEVAEPDGSDANFKFIVTDKSLIQYNIDHPKATVVSLDEFESLGDEKKDWLGDGTIRVAEYWYKTRELEPVYFLADDPWGDGKYEDELARDDDDRLIGVAYDMDGQPISRMTMRTRVYWSLINGLGPIEGNADLTAGREYVKGAKYIPIIRAVGKKVLVEKKYIYAGMIRDAIEPCLAADFWLSAITEMVALGPKAPWVVAYEAIAAHEQMWSGSNIENYAALFYDHKDGDGNDLPAPFRSFGEPPIESMKWILQFADEDLKRVMGIYNRSLGASGPEHSGVAIQAVQRESDVANYNYLDNLKRGIGLEAKIYLDLIPKIYDDEQVMQIIRPNGKEEKVEINKMFRDPNTGEEKKYDMTSGDYDSEIEIGPGFNTQRQEASAMMMEMIKYDPTCAPYISDIMARMSDSPARLELEQRLRARVPPNAMQADSGSSDIPPAVKAQYDAQSQQIEQLTQAFQALQDELKSKEREYQHEMQLKAMELSSAERQAALRVEGSLAQSEMAAKSQASMAMLEHTLGLIAADVAEFKKAGPVEPDFSYDPEKGLSPAQEAPPAAQEAQNG